MYVKELNATQSQPSASGISDGKPRAEGVFRAVGMELHVALRWF